MRLQVFLFFLVAGLAFGATDPAASTSHPLKWDAMEKSLTPKPGDGAADFVFNVTNTSTAPVEILQLRPSCGCTVADMPQNPWILAPGAKGSFRATIEFRGKHGKFSKAIYVTSTLGTQVLGVVVNIPEMDEAELVRNQQLAVADRQAVFRGKCATCHAAPAAGKTGADLFMATCAVCHISERRATMVPDLLVARTPRDAAFWRTWITEGKEQTLMPAFAKDRGGPLTPAQVDSLVEFTLAAFPKEPRQN